MTKKTYICNVCRGEYSHELAVDGLVGFVFKSDGSLGLEKPPYSENHVCIKCLHGMYFLRNQYNQEKGTK